MLLLLHIVVGVVADAQAGKVSVADSDEQHTLHFGNASSQIRSPEINNGKMACHGLLAMFTWQCFNSLDDLSLHIPRSKDGIISVSLCLNIQFGGFNVNNRCDDRCYFRDC
jgi:hypothetical protein